MNLLKKLRPLALGLMLSAATLPIFNCTTIGPWVESRREYVPTGVERKAEKITGTETTKQKTLDISDLIEKDNSYFVGVSNSLWETNYQLKDISRIKQLREVMTEERGVKKLDANQIALRGVLPPVVGTGGGALVGVVFAVPKDSSSKYQDKGFNTNRFITSMIVGAGLGIALSSFLEWSYIKHKKPDIETRQKITGRTEEGTPIYESTEKRVSREGWAYQNQPAKSLRVKLSLGEGFDYFYTDENGELNLSSILGENLFFPGQNASESYLEKIVRGNPLIGQIKTPVLDVLLKDFINSVDRYNHSLTVATDESSSQTEKVQNASRNFVISTYGISDRAIYDIVSQFVDEEINPSVKSIKFVVRDYLTHVPIDGTTLEMSTDAPLKSVLAGRYFTGELREFAEKSILNYLVGDSTISNCSSKPEFSVYSPSRIFAEVTHPKYNFISGEISVEEYLTKPVIVEMVDVGSKVRTQSSEEVLGRIGE